LAYEDVTLTTSDNVKLKAYVIPARRRNTSLDDMRGMTMKQREQIGEKAVEEWMAEMGKEDAVEVSKSDSRVLPLDWPLESFILFTD
jgi:hypothetical protein